ncbi:MAG TPA: formate dehydrogenase subunit gamma [Steroidobacteraceae bacterium]|nr:formate dehydrogenase subunit gamma [Steroidobacteraceae bacterium]
MRTLEPAARAEIDAVIARLKGEPGPLLLVLHAVQDALGHIPPAAVPVIADALNLSRAEVHGCLTFYHYFRDYPAGRHTIRICRAEACQSMNADALVEHAKQRLAIDFHQTTPDGGLSLEPVYCLGNCACSPAVMIDRTLYGRVTPERFDELLEEWGEGS